MTLEIFDIEKWKIKRENNVNNYLAKDKAVIIMESGEAKIQYIREHTSIYQY